MPASLQTLRTGLSALQDIHMTNLSPTPTILYADQEHNAIRLLIPVLLLLSFCLGFMALNWLLGVLLPGQDSRVVLACVGAVPLGLLLAYLGEAGLKRFWRSGRRVLLHEDRVTLQIGPDSEQVLVPDILTDLLLWYFPLSGYPRGGRERRVPASWFCVAASVQQDETRAIVFCFAAPGRLQQWQQLYDFTALDPSEIYDRSLTSRITLPTRPEIPPHVIAGKHGRHWLAERSRWSEGLELTPPDFEILLQRVHRFKMTG